MDGPETSEAKAEDKGEPEEAAAEIEAGGRRKEIADDFKVSTEKSRPLFLYPLNTLEFLLEKNSEILIPYHLPAQDD